jgi:hypothetical protein
MVSPAGFASSAAAWVRPLSRRPRTQAARWSERFPNTDSITGYPASRLVKAVPKGAESAGRARPWTQACAFVKAQT